jgi:hypothetical protein
MVKQITLFLCLLLSLVGCTGFPKDLSVSPVTSLPAAATILPTAIVPATAAAKPTRTSIPSPTPVPPIAAIDLSPYAFPVTIDPSDQYLFYLHGKIIEDQGLPAISPDFGEYEYLAILQRLSEFGMVVISDQRLKNTDGMVYARKVAGQVQNLLEAGVPAPNITVVGASKGAGIVIDISYLLMNQDLNFVIMAICSPDTIAAYLQNQVNLYGNVLSIYDSADTLAGSCQELFSFSQGKGISRSAELVLNVGTGHGILYQPLDEWIIPVVDWARGL